MRDKYHLQALGIFTLVWGVAAAGILLSLGGCEERVVTHTDRVGMEVVAVHLSSKTNSTVDLRVIGTNIVYRSQRLNCSRDKARNVAIGSKWDVWTEDFRYGDRYGTSVLGTSAICKLSN